MKPKIRLIVLLAAIALPGVAQAQSAACAYGAPRECYDPRDNTDRGNRDDLTNRTRPVAITPLDITDRANRDDLTNRTRLLAIAPIDITDRGNRDDLTNRTWVVAITPLDVTDRHNRDDTRDLTRACP